MPAAFSFASRAAAPGATEVHRCPEIKVLCTTSRSTIIVSKQQGYSYTLLYDSLFIFCQTSGLELFEKIAGPACTDTHQALLSTAMLTNVLPATTKDLYLCVPMALLPSLNIRASPDS